MAKYCEVCNKEFGFLELNKYKTRDGYYYCPKCMSDHAMIGVYNEFIVNGFKTPWYKSNIDATIKLVEDANKEYSIENNFEFIFKTLFLNKETRDFILNFRLNQGHKKHNISEILKIEYLETTKSLNYQTQKGHSGFGGALIGGILLGPVGAIAGGLGGRKQATYEQNSIIDSARIKFTFKDGTSESEWFINGQEVIINSADHLETVSVADQIIALFNSLMIQKQSDVGNKTKKQKLIELQELLTDNLITQDEFEAHKKIILTEN